MIPSERTLHRVGGRNTGTEREKVRIEPWHTQNTPSTRRRMAADHEARTIKPFCRKTPVITPPTLHQPPPSTAYYSVVSLFARDSSRRLSSIHGFPVALLPPFPPLRWFPLAFPPPLSCSISFFFFLSSFSFFSPRSFFLSSLLSPCTRSLYRGLW